MKLLLGDSAEKLQEISEKSVDLVVTSPPYDNMREYKGYSFDFEKIAHELFRVVKDGGVVVWVVGDQTIKGSETGTSFKQALFFKEIGFNIHDTMIYHKLAPPLTHNRYEQHFEYMFVFSKNKPAVFNGLREEKSWFDARRVKGYGREKDGRRDIGSGNLTATKLKGNIWHYEIGGGKMGLPKESHDHPAVFPLQLAKDHILSWSNEDDVVLDPFMGSGTTGIAALELKRNFIGIEISEEYFYLAKHILTSKAESLDDNWMFVADQTPKRC